MKSADVNASIVNFYMNLLSGLAPEVKIDLVTKVLASMKPEFKNKNGKKNSSTKSILGLSGKWESDATAEELIEELRSARTFNRPEIEL